MIVHTLLLALKQECEQISDEHKEAAADRPCSKNSINKELHKDASTKTCRIYVRGLVTMLGGKLVKYWKIGIHWLTVLRRWLKPFDANTALELSQFK
jgi:hypothetical protein